MLVLDMIFVDWIVKKEKFTGTLRHLSHTLDPLGLGAWQTRQALGEKLDYFNFYMLYNLLYNLLMNVMGT